MGVISFESIDSFVAQGISEAAESIGVEVSSNLRNTCIGPGDKTKQLQDFVSRGNPFAYLVFVVSDSFKSGFPNNRVVPYITCKSRIKASYKFGLNILHDFENAHVSEQEEGDFTNPLLKDVADFLLISMSVNPDFLFQFKRHYTLSELEFKTSRYYGQASLDIKKAQGNDGLVMSLYTLADEFPKYLNIMKRFSNRRLNQEIVNERIFEIRETEFKGKAYDEKLDYFLAQYQLYSQLTKKEVEPKNIEAVNIIIADLNETAERLKKINPDFNYQPIPLLKNADTSQQH